MFLPPSKEAQNDTDGARGKKKQRCESDIAKVRIGEVAKNGNKEAQMRPKTPQSL